MMTEIPGRLLEAAEQIREGKQPESISVREFIRWWNAKGRGRGKVRDIREALAKVDVETQPDFDEVNLDSSISLVSATHEGANGEGEYTESAPPDVTSGTNGSVGSRAAFVGGAVTDPTHRVSRLASANKAPISVNPNSTLQEAVHLMLFHELSQLPVMQGERDVKGMVSWHSIGLHLFDGNASEVVRDYMDLHREIRSDASLFEAIPVIVEHQYVLVRDGQNKISGMVTTSDLSEQFRQLSESFLLIGEIENHIRSLIDGKFTVEELAANRDPSDEGREVERVDDLSVGEYKRLLENPEHWDKLSLKVVARKYFVEQLENIRDVRNRVMHFEPDGIEEGELEILRRFTNLLRKLQKLNER